MTKYDLIDKRQHEFFEIINTFIRVINAKDHYTYAHTKRVALYCRRFGEKLNLSEQDQKILKYAASLHDIGKVEIDQMILNKKTPLNNDEWLMLKKHPEKGAAIISNVKTLRGVIPLVLHHHERFDGKGYPSGLKGEEIPYLARILTVADSFDAMTSHRPYKEAKTFEEAVIEMHNCSFSQFDPEIVKEFILLLDELNPELNLKNINF